MFNTCHYNRTIQNHQTLQKINNIKSHKYQISSLIVLCNQISIR